MTSNSTDSKVSSGKYRNLSPLVRCLSNIMTTLGLMATIVYLFHIGVSFWGEYVVGTSYLHLLLALFLPQVFFWWPITPKSGSKFAWYDAILVIISFIIPFYLFLNGESILFGGWEIAPPQYIFILGLILWAVILEAARRAVGWFFFFLALVASIYPLFASELPGMLNASSFSLRRVTGYHMVGPESIVGLPIKVLGEMFIGFMFFGVTLAKAGAAEFFVKASSALMGKFRGGTAKVAIIASGMVGSLSGSVITNVITSGTVTIPAMKKAGFQSRYAGAVEACASTGGAIMPPIMGAAAFLMAMILEVDYSRIVLAAVIPAVLYYLGLFVQIDAYAASRGLAGLPAGHTRVDFRDLMAEGWCPILSLVILVYVLFVVRQEAQAPFYAALPLLIFPLLRRKNRLDVKGLGELIESISKVLGEITAILSAIGFLIGSLLLTGTAQTLSTEIIDLAGGNVVLLVVLGAVASFVLGVGLTISACYLLLAVLLAPTLVQAGIDPIAAHMFLIYCGTLSFITPPVALGAYAAASLAGANPMNTGVVACRLGAVLFLLPVFMVFYPELVLVGTPGDIISVAAQAIFGTIILSYGLGGYLIGMGRLNMPKRIVTIACGLLIFLPGWLPTCIGSFILAVLFLSKLIPQRFSKKQAEKVLT